MYNFSRGGVFAHGNRDNRDDMKRYTLPTVRRQYRKSIFCPVLAISVGGSQHHTQSQIKFAKFENIMSKVKYHFR